MYTKNLVYCVSLSLLFLVFYLNIVAGFSLLALYILLGFYLYRLYKRFRRGMNTKLTQRPTTPPENGKIYLHVPSLRPWGYPNASPFSCKLETFLRMAKIPYEIVPSIFDGPTGKVPWIERNGVKMFDSQIIMETLMTETPDFQDAHLTPQERGLALAVNRMLSEHTVATLGYWRNVVCVKESMREYLFDKSVYTWPLDVLVPWMVRRATSAKLKAKGLLDHKYDQIIQIGCKDLRALSDILGNRPFLFGDRPCSADAAAFGILSSLLWIPIDTPLKRFVFGNPNMHNLNKYLHTIREKFYADTTEGWYTGGELAVNAGFVGKIEPTQKEKKE